MLRLITRFFTYGTIVYEIFFSWMAPSENFVKVKHQLTWRFTTKSVRVFILMQLTFSLCLNLRSRNLTSMKKKLLKVLKSHFLLVLVIYHFCIYVILLWNWCSNWNVLLQECIFKLFEGLTDKWERFINQIQPSNDKWQENTLIKIQDYHRKVTGCKNTFKNSWF